MNQKSYIPHILTAGSAYLDIDAYACMVAMAELIRLQGGQAIAYSNAPCNYSVCSSLRKPGLVAAELPEAYKTESARYIIVDVSDPDFIGHSVPLDRVVAVYDHHVGFEEYWQERIGEGTHIEFLGAAATLIYREWQRAGLREKMSCTTARLLVAAILDNTLNLTSSNTTEEDRTVFRALCDHAQVDDAWCAAYFSEVQASVAADLKNALFYDAKTIGSNGILPPHIAQICVWDAVGVLDRLMEIREWFQERWDSWMMNVIDLKHRCSYFVCDDTQYQGEIERIFEVCFADGVAKSSVAYLRKEIIKKTYTTKDNRRK